MRTSGLAADRPTVSVASPEGVPIDLPLADLGSRAVAWGLDTLAILLLSAVLGVVAVLASMPVGGLDGGAGGFVLALVLVALFLLRSFYFVFFELRWQGRTPGKRAQGVRVVSRSGGPLSVEMIFARNLTREVEIFLPLAVLLEPSSLVPGAGAWVQLGALGWAVVLLAFPLLNRQRARVGDLLAGTVVVEEPQSRLEADLARPTVQSRIESELRFSRQQLELYGTRELAVLEEALRRTPGEETTRLLREIAHRIQAKIGWRPAATPPPARAFLVAFYAAQRAHLEQGLLLGEVREQKVEGRLEESPEPPPPP